MWRRAPFLRRMRKSPTSALPTRGFPARAALSIVVICATLGCDSVSFVPPQPEELRGAMSAAPGSVIETAPLPAVTEAGPVSARSIAVVLGPHDDPDESEQWKVAVRSQAGREKVKIRILDPSGPASTQAALVREAVTHRPRVLVVQSAAADDPPLSRAIEEAQSQGIPVVVAGRLPSRDKSARAAFEEAKAHFERFRRSSSTDRRGDACI